MPQYYPWPPKQQTSRLLAIQKGTSRRPTRRRPTNRTLTSRRPTSRRPSLPTANSAKGCPLQCQQVLTPKFYFCQTSRRGITSLSTSMPRNHTSQGASSAATSPRPARPCMQQTDPASTPLALWSFPSPSAETNAHGSSLSTKSTCLSLALTSWVFTTSLLTSAGTGWSTLPMSPQQKTPAPLQPPRMTTPAS